MQVLKSMKITWKETLAIPISWNTDEVITQRVEFIAKMTDLLVRKKEFIYVDEQGYDLHKARKQKGHALAGRPATVSLQPKGDRISVIAALSLSGGLFFHHFVHGLGAKKRGVDAKDFDYFLGKLRMDPRVRGKVKVIIFDNAKIHHAELLADTISALHDQDHIEVLYLPPYSPFLNAIEFAFNVLKKKVQGMQFNGTKELEGAIATAIRDITPENAAGFFDHAQSFWEQAKLGIPFRGKILDPLRQEPDESAPASAPPAASIASAHGSQ